MLETLIVKYILDSVEIVRDETQTLFGRNFYYSAKLGRGDNSAWGGTILHRRPMRKCPPSGIRLCLRRSLSKTFYIV